MGSGAADDQCQMRDCTGEATRTMSFERHEDVAVCDRHYRRNVAVKYLTAAALSVVLAAIGLGIYWLVL